MATNKRFTDLPAVTSLSDSDIIPVTASSATSKITKANLKTTLGVPVDTGDLTNNEGFITDISSQDLSTADNSTSAFITLSEVPPAGITALVEDNAPQLGANLDVSGSIITTSATDGDITLTPDGTGVVKVGATGLDMNSLPITNASSVNGVELTSGTGGIVVGDNTLTIAGGDMTLTGAGTATITIPDITGQLITSDTANAEVKMPSGTTLRTVGANGITLETDIDNPDGTNSISIQGAGTGINILSSENTVLSLWGVVDFGVIFDISNVTTSDVTLSIPNQTGTLALQEINPAPTADSYSGQTILLDASEDFAVGEVGFIDSSGTVTRADADAIATGGACVLALEAIDQSVEPTGKFLLNGVFHADTIAPSWTVGGIVYLSTTVGDMTTTAPSGTGDVIQVLGIALSADTILFNPQLTQIEHA